MLCLIMSRLLEFHWDDFVSPTQSAITTRQYGQLLTAPGLMAQAINIMDAVYRECVIVLLYFSLSLCSFSGE